MQIPLIIPLPFFFIYLLIKIMIILIAPFALGVIVRLRSQGKRKETNSTQKSDKTNPPPSPNPDGEDKPEDSYWTRFKKWCSEHSLAIGLGITLVAATLIYIYREDISRLIHEVKPPENKEEGKKAEAEKLTKHACEEVFFKKEDKIDGESYIQKSKKFTKFMQEINLHYENKNDTSKETVNAKRTIKIFLEKYPELFIDSQASSEFLSQKTSFVEGELAKKPEDQNFNFKRNLAFLSCDQNSYVAKQMHGHWCNLMFSYLLDVLDTPSRKTSEQK